MLNTFKKRSSGISFGAGIGKGFAYHFNVRPLVNAYLFAATALYLLSPRCKAVFSGYSFLVAAQNFTGADFIVFPELGFAGGAANN